MKIVYSTNDIAQLIHNALKRKGKKCLKVCGRAAYVTTPNAPSRFDGIFGVVGLVHPTVKTTEITFEADVDA